MALKQLREAPNLHKTRSAQPLQNEKYSVESLAPASTILKVEKCEFHQGTISFLGYVISPRGFKMDYSKVRAVTEWPELMTVKELQRFLGFTNFYRRFIQNYSSIATPLTSLLKSQPKRLKWSKQARAVFIHLKKSFTTAPVLRHLDPDHPFIVEDRGHPLSETPGKV